MDDFSENLPKKSEAASALVLVLLITALLFTIAVSFLSTSRVEMIAARNFSRQNAASGLAEMATQQAMAQIQQGFTVTGNATTVITTQPGAIRQFVFSGGNISSNTLTELFSGGSNSTATTNGTVNINNLRNPSSNATLTSNSSNNQWTITGFANETIRVPMEEVTTTQNGANQVVGRIAYYVDDEGTKLNVNSATGDRPTLNIASSRSMSLSSLASASQSANFTQIINGNATSGGNATGDIKNWAHFFRPEQVGAAVSGFGQDNVANLSVASGNGSDYHIKKTPWGAPRLFINDLPTDTVNAAASVNAIYNALSSSQLRDIYGATFADKYTDLGLKQIAANILQMRDPNTNTVNASFTSTVPRIGANASQLVSIANCCPTATATKFPSEYFGQAPYAYISEIGMSAAWCNRDWYNGTSMVTFQLCNFVSIINPTQSTIPLAEVNKWRIDMKIDSFTMDITFQTSNGTTTKTYGPTGFANNDPWGHELNEIRAKRNARNSLYGTPEIQESEWGDNSGYWYTTALGNYTSGTSTPWGRGMRPGEELQLGFYIYPYAWGTQGLSFTMNTNIKILDISNIKVKYDYITLTSVTTSGNTTTSTLRDFVLGSDTGDVDVWLLAPHPNGPGVLPRGWPDSSPWQKSWAHGVHPSYGGMGVVPPSKSMKRVDGRLRFSANMTSNATANMTQRSYMRSWSASGNDSWLTKADGTMAFSTNNTTANIESYPSITSGNPIPGDAVSPQNTPFYDFPAPFASTLQFIGANLTTANSSVFTSPQELGKVHTNVRHRKLRFTPQHPNEVSTGSGGAGNQTFIPDWAMLDVISFGSNVTSVPAPAPVNLNGRFHVPSGSPQPAPRMAAVESALKALDSATSVGNPFNSSNNSTTDRTQYMGGGNVSATIAGNIGNLTWSTGNFTSGSATWGKGNATTDPGSRRKTANFPVNQFVLPAEVTEISRMADVTSLESSGNATIKTNEGRLSSLFPGATTQSRFFTIYAYAQSLDKLGNIDSEQVTKTLVKVEEQSPTTSPPTYKVIKLYSQPINAQ